MPNGGLCGEPCHGPHDLMGIAKQTQDRLDKLEKEVEKQEKIIEKLKKENASLKAAIKIVT